MLQLTKQQMDLLSGSSPHLYSLCHQYLLPWTVVAHPAADLTKEMAKEEQHWAETDASLPAHSCPSMKTQSPSTGNRTDNNTVYKICIIWQNNMRQKCFAVFKPHCHILLLNSKSFCTCDSLLSIQGSGKVSLPMLVVMISLSKLKNPDVDMKP